MPQEVTNALVMFVLGGGLTTLFVQLFRARTENRQLKLTEVKQNSEMDALSMGLAEQSLILATADIGRLKAANAELANQVSDLRAENAAIRAENAAKNADYAQLQLRVHQLETQIKQMLGGMNDGNVSEPH